MRREGDWWLGGFLAGFLIGLALTVIYVRLVPNTLPPTPAQLNQHDKEIYLVLIAAAYRYNGDLDKAKRRLARFEEPDIGQTITALAQKYISTNANIKDIRSLASLARGLGETEGTLLIYLITPTATQPPRATSQPTARAITPVTSIPNSPESSPEPDIPDANTTVTLRPTFTPGPNAPFGLAQSVALCDNSVNGILRVYIRDRNGHGVPGIEVLVTWPGGEDSFFTGLKSESDPGYADFQMEASQIYRVELLDIPAAIAKDINEAAETRCPNMPDGVIPSWQVVFQQGVGQ